MSLPMSTVPFRRDPDFIDRIGLSQELDEKCGREAAQVALVGIGGVGSVSQDFNLSGSLTMLQEVTACH